MRISDWSSDVCSSDLLAQVRAPTLRERGIDDVLFHRTDGDRAEAGFQRAIAFAQAVMWAHAAADFRQRVGLVGEIGGFEQAAFLGQPQPFGNRILQRSEEHTSELQSLMRISYAVFCLKKKK